MRHRFDGSPEATAQRLAEREERERFVDSLRVSRDPCFWCGARGDYGCGCAA